MQENKKSSLLLNVPLSASSFLQIRNQFSVSQHTVVDCNTIHSPPRHCQRMEAHRFWAWYPLLSRFVLPEDFSKLNINTELRASVHVCVSLYLHTWNCMGSSSSSSSSLLACSLFPGILNTTKLFLERKKDHTDHLLITFQMQKKVWPKFLLKRQLKLSG